MRQLKFLSILLLLSVVAPLAALADSFKVLETDLELGKTGTLQFVLENETPYYGFQAEVTLPDGLTAVPKGTDGSVDFTLSDRASAGDYRVNSNVKNGKIIFGTFSANHKAFTGSNGVLVDLKVNVAETFKGGDVVASNIKFITAENKDVPLVDSSTTLGIKATELTLSANTAKIKVGGTEGSITLTATVTPENATNKEVTWSSSKAAVATVDENGEVTGVALGTTTITASLKSNPTVTASCEVTVEATPVTGITLSPSSLTLTEGDKAKLTETIAPATATDKSVTWGSSNPDVATVDENGNVTAMSEGEAVITVKSSNDIEATCKVTVAAFVIPVESITLETALELIIYGTETLKATINPSNATDKEITWTSSDTNIATVDKNGKVTAVGVGVAKITATCGTVSATCEVTVNPILAESVTITAEDNKSELKVDETVKLTATVAPENTTYPSLTWSSSDENVATVKGGVVTAVALGEATITASCNEGEDAVSDTFKVTVVKTPVESITLSESTLSLVEEGTATLTATVTPDKATYKTVKWSSDKAEIATVDENGKVTAVAPGTATITATADGISATCSVTVTAKVIEITGITLDKTEATLTEGETLTLTATIAPENANTDKAVTWESSDTAVATVDENGVVTTVAAGTATITVTTANGKTAACAITVEKAPVAVTGITLNKTAATLTEGESQYLIAIVAPADADDKSFTWSSSDETVATIATNGKVSALKAGTATITATSKSNSAISVSCIVTVEAKDAETAMITWPMATQTDEAYAYDFTPIITEGADGLSAGEPTLGSEIVWKEARHVNYVPFATFQPSEQKSAATEGHTVTFSIEIEEGYTFEPKSLSYNANIIGTNGGNFDLTYTWDGKTETLQEKFAPKRNNEEKGWFSTETLPIVNAGAASGKFEVTFFAYNLAPTKQIGLSDVVIKGKLVKVEHPILNVTLDQTSAKVNIGESVTLTATVEADDAADKTVTWTSSDDKIASVDQTGKVTGVAEGTATITATAGDKSATCEITVERPVIAVSGISLNVNEASIMQTKSLTLVATVVPDDATDKTVAWSSDNEAVATVDQAGKVTGVALGTANITAKAGEFTATCVVTVTEYLGVTTSGGVKMTYVNMDEPDTAYGEIAAGESAKAGFNKIDKGVVGFGNTSWGVDYITYLQVDASVAEGAIIGATLSFEGSGSTDSKRTTTWGVGYNSSAWSADMTYNTADKTITTLGDTKSTSTKSATTFEKFTFDISDAVKKVDENGLVTILVYETAAAGGYIKNPTVNIEWTKEPTYNVTFTETSGVEGVKVTLDGSDVTNGTELIKGTYSFTATAEHYKDYTGNFTVADEDLEVKFEMTPKAIWNYTVKNNVNDEVKTGTCEEGESVKIPYNRYILATDGTVWMKDASNKEYNYTFTPDADNYVATITYNATDMTDGIYLVEGEDIEGMTEVTGSNANIRCSNAAGGYAEEAVEVYTLNPGIYKVTMGVWGNAGATFSLKAGEEEILSAETKGYWYEATSEEEFEIATETVLTFEGATSSKPLDYILIRKTGEYVAVTSIKLSAEALELELGEETQITATSYPDEATHHEVTWTTSNENVATVDEEGNVKAIGIGTATITAHCFCGAETAECKVKVYPSLGDANMDGKLDITDATDINNYVVGKKEVADEDLEFYLRGANANGDAEGKITVADASATVSLVLAQTPAETAQARISAYADESADALVIGHASATSLGTVIPVALDYSMDYVAFQADIILPEGANVDVKAANSIADSHILMSKKHADNHIRVAIFNFRNEAITAGNAPVIEIISDSNIAASDVMISNIIASDADANGYVLGSKLGATTGVDAIGLDGNAPVKVFDVNGMFVGDSLEGLQQGTYIVRQGEEVRKLRVR